jgi:hypothetical protein
LDGNESYDDIGAFARFIESLEDRRLGLFQHIAFIEQPLARALTDDRATAEAIAGIAARKPIVIDEADGDIDSFRKAFQLGYAGVSHKNCKGFFKSLLNYTYCKQIARKENRLAFQTGEDLSNMPLVPLHQDFAALGVLNINHCERNGQHYSFGLAHLTDEEKEAAMKYHSDLYVKRRGEMFLSIHNGQVICPSLQCNGFGVRFEPDWDAMSPLDDWEPRW